MQYPEGTVCVSDRDRCSNRYAESGYCTEGKERLFVYAYDPREKSRDYFSQVGTVFFEVLPLSLEEIFISETEVAGYDIRKLIMG